MRSVHLCLWKTCVRYCLHQLRNAFLCINCESLHNQRFMGSPNMNIPSEKSNGQANMFAYFIITYNVYKKFISIYHFKVVCYIVDIKVISGFISRVCWPHFINVRPIHFSHKTRVVILSVLKQQLVSSVYWAYFHSLNLS